MSDSPANACDKIADVSSIATTIVISLFIILKFVEIIFRQVNQNKNFNQQNKKIKIMEDTSNSSETTGLNDQQFNDIANKISEIVIKRGLILK